MSCTRALRHGLALLLAPLLALALSPCYADTAPADTSLPTTVAADSLPTVQVDGVVWDQVIVGDTVYAVGSFTTARPAGAAAGTGTVTRSNMLAYSLSTGKLIDSFAPSFNGPVKVVRASPKGTTLFVGGAFTQVDGVPRSRIAAVSATTGQLSTSFAPGANTDVKAMAVRGSTVYIGGLFSQVNGTPRTGFAALNAADGSLLAFNPDLDGGNVWSIAVSPGGARLVIGGAFTSVDNSDDPGFGLAMFDASTGQLLPLAANQQIHNGGAGGAITSLTATRDGFYGTAFRYLDVKRVSTLEGPFKIGWDGKLVWVADCHGDSYAIAVTGSVAYVSSHEYYCGNLGTGGFAETVPRAHHFATAFTTYATGVNRDDQFDYPSHAGQPSPTLLQFYPQFEAGTYTGLKQATWDVATNGAYVVYGGEFPTVNGATQQGIARFAVSDLAPDREGPQVSGAAAAPTVVSHWAGMTRVTWPANNDPDNATLTYRLYRDTGSGARLVDTQTQVAQFWQSHTLTWMDHGLALGGAVRYRVVASDPFGNTAISDWTSATVSSRGGLTAYPRTVLADGATTYWRFGASGPGTDSSGDDSATVGHGVTVTTTTPGASGALRSVASFDGSDTANVTSSRQVQAPDQFALELWFRTRSTTGGRLAGFGDGAAGAMSSSYDRQIYLTPGGRVSFGVYRGSKIIIATKSSYNDGAWHHVVANLGAKGMSLYVDGAKVGSRSKVNGAAPYLGRWRIGTDMVWSKPGEYDGDIAEAAIYGAPLSSAQVRTHYLLAKTRISGRAGRQAW